MFVVRPIAKREEQKKICSALCVPYIAESLSYYAANLAPDRETVSVVIGICQFTVGDVGQILTLSCPPSFIEDEAMIVLCRAVMYFMHRVGIKNAVMRPEAGPAEVLSKTGFVLRDHIYHMDLESFYQAPCRYEAE